MLISKGYCGSIELLMLLVTCDGMVVDCGRVELMVVMEIGSSWCCA